MSHVDPGPLAAYNSLMDPHLSGYFSVMKRRKHLRKAGLISKKGEVVSETTYRISMARKEHKKHVRDLLAQAIVHKTLDVERGRQVQIKQKLEEIAKIELVRRVRSERGRKGDEEVLPYLSPRPPSSRGRPQSGRSEASSNRSQRPRSAPNRRSTSPHGRPKSSKAHRSSNGINTIYVDNEGYPIDSQQDNKQGKSKYPKDEIDSRHLYALDQTALQEYTLTIDAQDKGDGPSPYTYSQVPNPPKHAKGSPRSASSRHAYGSKSKGQSKDQENDKPNMGSLMLHRMEPAVKYQERVQSFCEVTMHYFGSSLHLDYERFDPRDEISIEQQHCGGNTLVVFKELIHPGSDFTFVSRRHRGYPFSLTMYVNGVLDCRVSACCEYKHRKGVKLGGKQGHFGVVCVDGAAPCYRCQVESKVDKKKKKKKDKQSNDGVKVDVEDDKSQQNEDVDVKGEGGDDDHQQEDDYADDFEDEQNNDTKRADSSDENNKPVSTHADAPEEEKVQGYADSDDEIPVKYESSTTEVDVEESDKDMKKDHY